MRNVAKFARKILEAPYKALDRISFAVFAFAAATLASVRNAHAAGDLGTFAGQITKLVEYFGPVLKVVFAIGGFFLIGLGFWQLYQKSQQPGQPKGGALIAILIGGCLLGAAVLAGQITSQMSGSEGALGDLKLGG